MGQAPRIGIIGGGGWLGGAIAHAIVAAAITTPAALSLSYRRSSPVGIPDAYVTRDNQELVDRSDLVILSIRPQDLPELRICAEDKLVISVMAGIPQEVIAVRTGTRRVIRALPNAAAAVGRSYTPWFSSPEVRMQDKSLAGQIFTACGIEDEIPAEWMIDYFTGFTGSGPAFPALLASAMAADAVSRGIPAGIASKAARALMIGTGRLMESSERSPQEFVETFMEYEGTTAAAIATMVEAGIFTTVESGLTSALARSRELAKTA